MTNRLAVAVAVIAIPISGVAGAKTGNISKPVGPTPHTHYQITTAGHSVVVAGAWTIVPSPNVAGATNSLLNGVSCVTSSACVAVGDINSGSNASSTPLIETLSGGTWVSYPVRAPAVAACSFKACRAPARR